MNSPDLTDSAPSMRMTPSPTVATCANPDRTTCPNTSSFIVSLALAAFNSSNRFITRDSAPAALIVSAAPNIVPIRSDTFPEDVRLALRYRSIRCRARAATTNTKTTGTTTTKVACASTVAKMTTAAAASRSPARISGHSATALMM